MVFSYQLLLLIVKKLTRCIANSSPDTGGTIHQGIQELKRNGVRESSIILLTLFVTPEAVQNIQCSFPEV